jgi:excisionase family DNA binding protein
MSRSSALGAATHVEPTPQDRDQLAAVLNFLAAMDAGALQLLGGPVLPPALTAVVAAAATQLSQGHGVTVVASETMLTPEDVAELLGLSRPFVVRLMDDGKIPFEFKPGSRHRVVRLSDALDFQAARERRRAGRRQIADTIDDNRLPY